MPPKRGPRSTVPKTSCPHCARLLTATVIRRHLQQQSHISSQLVPLPIQYPLHNPPSSPILAPLDSDELLLSPLRDSDLELTQDGSPTGSRVLGGGGNGGSESGGSDPGEMDMAATGGIDQDERMSSARANSERRSSNGEEGGDERDGAGMAGLDDAGDSEAEPIPAPPPDERSDVNNNHTSSDDDDDSPYSYLSPSATPSSASTLDSDDLIARRWSDQDSDDTPSNPGVSLVLPAPPALGSAWEIEAARARKSSFFIPN